MPTPGYRFVYAFVCGLLALSCSPAEPPPEAAETPAAAERLLANGREPAPGLYTGGQPTPEQLEAARQAGVRTIINLRPSAEPGVEGEAERVAALGMEYVQIPVAGAADLTEANARALAEALDGAGRPVVVHCASGNRVGGLLALKSFFVDGAGPEEALANGLAAGLTRLEPAVREVLERAATDETSATAEETRP